MPRIHNYDQIICIYASDTHQDSKSIDIKAFFADA